MNGSRLTDRDDEPVWRFDDGGLLVGPYSLSELRTYAAIDYITPGTEVVHENGRRLKAGDLGLFRSAGGDRAETAGEMDSGERGSADTPEGADSTEVAPPHRRWSYEQDRQAVGPFTESELLSLVAAGRIRESTPLIRDDGTRISASRTWLFDGEHVTPTMPRWWFSATFMGSVTWLALSILIVGSCVSGIRNLLEFAAPGQSWIDPVTGLLNLISLTVVGAAWTIAGCHAIFTGVCYDPAGRPHHHYTHRFGGLCILGLVSIQVIFRIGRLAEAVALLPGLQE